VEGRIELNRGSINEIISTNTLLPARKFAHVGRQANEVTHRLARRGLQTKEWVVMHFDMPDDVRSVVITETARVVNFPNLFNPLSCD
jgi:hypothetical protein